MCHICNRKYYLHQAKIMDPIYNLQKRLYKQAAEELYPDEDEVCEEGRGRIMTTPPPTDYYGKILKQFDWSLRKAPNYITYPNQFHFNFKPKETTKMNIQEKDCRRCGKLDEEGICKGMFKPDVELGCNDFTPISGRDCRNCERFNGKDKSCADGMIAASFPLACDQFSELKDEPQPSPTVLTYTDEDDKETRVTKGDKILSLSNVWSERPCSGEYRDMSIKFTEVGYNPDSEIHFTQDNLNLLPEPAFDWLLDRGFFIEAEEEKEGTFKIGDWFVERIDGYLCLLSLTRTDVGSHISMIPIEGSRPGKVWDCKSPILVADVNRITWEDIGKLAGAKDWFRSTTPPEIRRT